MFIKLYEKRPCLESDKTNSSYYLYVSGLSPVFIWTFSLTSVFLDMTINYLGEWQVFIKTELIGSFFNDRTI